MLRKILSPYHLLAKTLLPTYSKSAEDKKTKLDFKFHLTTSFKGIHNKFEEIRRCIKKKDPTSSNKREDTVEIRKAIEPNATRPQKVKYK